MANGYLPIWEKLSYRRPNASILQKDSGPRLFLLKTGQHNSRSGILTWPAVDVQYSKELRKFNAIHQLRIEYSNSNFLMSPDDAPEFRTENLWKIILFSRRSLDFQSFWYSNSLSLTAFISETFPFTQIFKVCKCYFIDVASSIPCIFYGPPTVNAIPLQSRPTKSTTIPQLHVKRRKIAWFRPP